jgi:hypothetical protein
MNRIAHEFAYPLLDVVGRAPKRGDRGRYQPQGRSRYAGCPMIHEAMAILDHG